MPESQATLRIQYCLDRLRQGDAAAHAELIAVAAERLRLLTRRMLRDYPGVHRWEQTDDVMQNAVLRLCRALEAMPLTTPRDFFRVAALQVRRELRDLARRYFGPEGLGAHHGSQAASPDDAAPALREPSDPSRNPVHLAAWTNFHEKVEALPEEERDVFDLLWYQELTVAEAAKMLNLSESTVKRRWQAARRRLHDLLGGELPF